MNGNVSALLHTEKQTEFWRLRPEPRFRLDGDVVALAGETAVPPCAVRGGLPSR